MFVEGGGRSKDLRTRCREGFHHFLARLNLADRRPKIVACGTRRDAFDRFCIAMSQRPAGNHLLLVDAEETVESGVPWVHVHRRPGDQWDRPPGATDDHLQFMAVCMESWLVSDRDALSRFYGQGFKAQRLPVTTNLETVDKKTLLAALETATRETTKGRYAKGKVSFATLGAIDIHVVRESMTFCQRFVTQLLALAEMA